MDTDIHKQRRNLLGVSLGLVIYQLSGGKVEPISFLGGGITLESGQTIITLAYIALAYLIWRYWLYAKPLHEEFRKVAQERVLTSKSYRSMISPLVNAFKKEGGVAYNEGWDAAMEIETEEKYEPIPVTVFVEHKFFSRQLHISVENPMGEYHPDRVTHNIPYIPYGLSVVAIVAAIFRVLYA